MKTKQLHSLLVVDDNPSDLEALETYFSPVYKVFTALNAADALALMKKKTFSAAIVDIILPDLRGEALLEALKKRWPTTEIIMLTAAEEEGMAEACFAKGAFDFFSKPYDLRRLERSVKRAVERSEMVRVLETRTPSPVKLSAGAKGFGKQQAALIKAYIKDLKIEPNKGNLPLNLFLAGFEAALLKELLATCAWNMSHAAKKLRIHRFNLRNKMKRLKITSLRNPRRKLKS